MSIFKVLLVVFIVFVVGLQICVGVDRINTSCCGMYSCYKFISIKVTLFIVNILLS
jgi:hypothetical protein